MTIWVYFVQNLLMILKYLKGLEMTILILALYGNTWLEIAQYANAFSLSLE